MAEVKLLIGGRNYVVTCRDGEEEHLEKLGQMVAEKMTNASSIASGLTENRQFLFATLLLADELSEARQQAASTPVQTENEGQASAGLARILENLADRVETLASTLENAAPGH